MHLKNFVKRLEEYASLDTACYSKLFWDNVGLLVEPSVNLCVEKVLITNDLTEPVFEEALKHKVNIILSYHPVIFEPLKRLTQSEWSQSSIVKCIENRIAVFSPHTTWDSIDGGINDWILKAFDQKNFVSIDTIDTVRSKTTPSGYTKTVKFNSNQNELKDKMLISISDQVNDIKFIGERELLIFDTVTNEYEFLTTEQGVISLISLAEDIYGLDVLTTLRIYEQDKPQMKNVGLGRIARFNEPIGINEIIDVIKSHLKIKIFRIALANRVTLVNKIKTLAVGAGCGTGLLNNLNVELIITGEFNHDEILHEVHRGVSVIVTDHTNTERGHHEYFKSKFTEYLKSHNENVELIISQVDRDPLEYS